jgi:hypothetical protein
MCAAIPTAVVRMGSLGTKRMALSHSSQSNRMVCALALRNLSITFGKHEKDFLCDSALAEFMTIP